MSLFLERGILALDNTLLYLPYDDWFILVIC